MSRHSGCSLLKNGHENERQKAETSKLGVKGELWVLTRPLTIPVTPVNGLRETRLHTALSFAVLPTSQFIVSNFPPLNLLEAKKWELATLGTVPQEPRG